MGIRITIGVLIVLVIVLSYIVKWLIQSRKSS